MPSKVKFWSKSEFLAKNALHWGCSLTYKRPLNRNWVTLDTSFLRSSAMLKHVLAIGWTSVRPSVRPSVCLSDRHTLVLCLNDLTYRQTVFTVHSMVAP